MGGRLVIKRFHQVMTQDKQDINSKGQKPYITIVFCIGFSINVILVHKVDM